jgi:hypothetical protein
MTEFCVESQKFVTEQVARPVYSWIQSASTSCRAAPTPLNFICEVFMFLLLVITFVIDIIVRVILGVICLVILVIEFVALLLNLILAIPFFGRLIKMVLNFVVEALWRITTWIDILAVHNGKTITRSLRTRVIILRDEEGIPLLADYVALNQALSRAHDIFLTQANVSMTNIGIHIPNANANSPALEPQCSEVSLLGDWLASGAYYEWVSTSSALGSNFLRFTGVGSEIVIIIVRNIRPEKAGCSLGIFTDYVVIDARYLDAIPHEIGHACGLLHASPSLTTNLMTPGATGTTMLVEQVSVFRGSRHVVF